MLQVFLIFLNFYILIVNVFVELFKHLNAAGFFLNFLKLLHLNINFFNKLFKHLNAAGVADWAEAACPQRHLSVVAKGRTSNFPSS